MIEFEYCSSIADSLPITLRGGGGSIWLLMVILVGFGVVCLLGANKNNVITMCFPRVSVYGGYPGPSARSIVLPGYLWLP